MVHSCFQMFSTCNNDFLLFAFVYVRRSRRKKETEKPAGRLGLHFAAGGNDLSKNFRILYFFSYLFFHRGDCSSSVLSFPVSCEPFAGLSRSKFSITLCQIRILRTTWRSLYSNVTFLEKADEEAKSKHFRHRRYLLNTPEHTSLGKATPLWRFVFMFNQSVIPLVRGFTYRTACR